MCLGGIFEAGSESSSTKTEIPPWMKRHGRQTYLDALKLSRKPFDAYDGDLVAGFNDDQLRGFDLLRNYQGDALNPSDYGGNIADLVGGFDIMQHSTPSLIDGNIQDYMDPYMQNVLSDVLGNIDESGEIARNNLDAGRTMAGAFGDARHGIESAQLTEDITKQKGQFANQMLSQAFNNAMGLKQQDIGNALNTFQANVGARSQGLNDIIGGYSGASALEGAELGNLMQYINALNASGTIQQQNDQANLDADYGQYLREYQHPFDMIDLRSRTLGMTPHNTTSTATTPTASPAAQGIGTAMNIASMFI